MKKPTREEILASVNKGIEDVIDYNLKVLFVGINPGLYTAAVGHHFGRPGNRFWKAVFEAGITDKLLHPSQQKELFKFGYGITNLVNRATVGASEVTKEEFIKGGKILLGKIIKYKPRWVAFVGIEAYRKAYGRPSAKVGYQKEKIKGANIWVLPNPSGLNAHYTPTQLSILFSKLKKRADISK